MRKKFYGKHGKQSCVRWCVLFLVVYIFRGSVFASEMNDCEALMRLGKGNVFKEEVHFVLKHFASFQQGKEPVEHYVRKVKKIFPGFLQLLKKKTDRAVPTLKALFQVVMTVYPSLEHTLLSREKRFFLELATAYAFYFPDLKNLRPFVWKQLRVTAPFSPVQGNAFSKTLAAFLEKQLLKEDLSEKDRYLLLEAMIKFFPESKQTIQVFSHLLETKDVSYGGVVSEKIQDLFLNKEDEFFLFVTRFLNSPKASLFFQRIRNILLNFFDWSKKKNIDLLWNVLKEQFLLVKKKMQEASTQLKFLSQKEEEKAFAQVFLARFFLRKVSPEKSPDGVRVCFEILFQWYAYFMEKKEPKIEDLQNISIIQRAMDHFSAFDGVQKNIETDVRFSLIEKYFASTHVWKKELAALFLAGIEKEFEGSLLKKYKTFFMERIRFWEERVKNSSEEARVLAKATLLTLEERMQISFREEKTSWWRSLWKDKQVEEDKKAFLEQVAAQNRQKVLQVPLLVRSWEQFQEQIPLWVLKRTIELDSKTKKKSFRWALREVDRLLRNMESDFFGFSQEVEKISSYLRKNWFSGRLDQRKKELLHLLNQSLESSDKKESFHFGGHIDQIRKLKLYLEQQQLWLTEDQKNYWTALLDRYVQAENALQLQRNFQEGLKYLFELRKKLQKTLKETAHVQKKEMGTLLTRGLVLVEAELEKVALFVFKSMAIEKEDLTFEKNVLIPLAGFLSHRWEKSRELGWKVWEAIWSSPSYETFWILTEKREDGFLKEDVWLDFYVKLFENLYLFVKEKKKTGFFNKEFLLQEKLKWELFLKHWRDRHFRQKKRVQLLEKAILPLI